MKNLDRFNGDTFAIYRLAVDRKDAGTSKQNLLGVAANVQARYLEYERLFAANQLETLVVDPIFAPIKQDLLKLYKYDNKAVRAIRHNIASLQPQQIRHTCQYCGMGSVETLDHVVSQSEFSEFVIHPYNLIPSCFKCNTHKSDGWINAGVRQFLNLYLDILPAAQFLFVDVIPQVDGQLDFKYRIEKPDGLTQRDWDLIASHFEKLQLLTRMKEKSVAQVTEIVNVAKNFLRVGLPQDTIRAAMRETVADNRASYGLNYWKAALEEALEGSGDFWNYVRIQ